MFFEGGCSLLSYIYIKFIYFYYFFQFDFHDRHLYRHEFIIFLLNWLINKLRGDV